MPTPCRLPVAPAPADDTMASLRYMPPPAIEEALLASLRSERPSLTRAEAGVALRHMAEPDTRTLPPRLRPKTTKHKGITRIDHPAKRTFGYFVRVTWNKQRRSKFFADSVDGDRLAALGAAIDWRNEAERELGKPRTERQVIGVSRTDTGIVGVRRTVKDGRERGAGDGGWGTQDGGLLAIGYRLSAIAARATMARGVVCCPWRARPCLLLSPYARARRATASALPDHPLDRARRYGRGLRGRG